MSDVTGVLCYLLVTGVLCYLLVTGGLCYLLVYGVRQLLVYCVIY